MNDYLLQKRDELPIIKREEEYQGADDPPKVDAINGIHQYGNSESHDWYISTEVKLPDGSGNPRPVKVLKSRKGINREIIANFHTNPFMNTQEYKMELSGGSYH